MSSVVITQFIGEAIKEQKLAKENGAAVCAVNAQLHDGSLKPIPCPELVCEHGFLPRSIFSTPDCGCIAKANETIFAETQNYILWAEDGHCAQKSNCFCEGGRCDIGLPCPKTPMVASGGAEGCDYSPHRYYYTWVSKQCGGCESEGPLSPPSNQVCGPANLGGGDAPPSGSCITHKRIYRASSGWKPGDERAIKNNSGVTLVGEVSAGSGMRDGLSVGSTTMISPITQRMRSMPSCMDGVGASGFGIFGWKGKTLYFSADGMVDTMFPEGKFCFDHEIKRAVYLGGSIYVLTDKWNYRIDEAAGESRVRYSNPPHRFELQAPIDNPYSVTTGNSGVYYISKSGIIVLSGAESLNIGSALFNTSQWKSMDIKNAKVHIYQQYLFLHSRDWEYTHLFEIEDGAHTDIAYSNHVRYPYQISAMHNDHNGDLLFASGENTYKFREGECYDLTVCDPVPPLCMECCPYSYEMPISHQVEVTDWVVAYLHIDARYGDVVFRLWDGDCGDRLIFEKTLSGCDLHEFKLPGCGRLSTYHTVELEGCATVYEMRLGTSNKAIGLN